MTTRTIAYININLSEKTVSVISRVVTGEGFILQQSHDLSDTTLVTAAQLRGASTWEEQDIAVLLDDRYPIIDPVRTVALVSHVLVGRESLDLVADVVAEPTVSVVN